MVIYITKFKIIPNPNEEEYLEVTNDVKENNGYCPCMSIKNQDTKCICKEFKEQNYEGECRCGRFVKIKI
jgi:hypothetical protein